MAEAEKAELEKIEALSRERQRVVEAVLFAMGGAVDGPSLAKACGCDARTARSAARQLQSAYEAANGALLIREYDGSFQMCTNPRYYDNLIRLVSAPKKPVLTDVVMETLSIIAFKSPATKVMIERIRGVKSDHAVNKLVEYGLIEEVGRLDAPGRPALFAPTEEFYRRFGVSSKQDLPKLGAEEQELLEEELQAEMQDALEDGVQIDAVEPEEVNPENVAVAADLPEIEAGERQLDNRLSREEGTQETGAEKEEAQAGGSEAEESE